jgi:hypothetical protein
MAPNCPWVDLIRARAYSKAIFFVFYAACASQRWRSVSMMKGSRWLIALLLEAGPNPTAFGNVAQFGTIIRV